MTELKLKSVIFDVGSGCTVIIESNTNNTIAEIEKAINLYNKYERIKEKNSLQGNNKLMFKN